MRRLNDTDNCGRTLLHWNTQYEFGIIIYQAIQSRKMEKSYKIKKKEQKKIKNLK